MSSLAYIHAGAVVDGTGDCYRYSLERRWAPGKSVCFIMLNPSTADGESDDPTIRKCVGFAKGWGFDAIEVVNLFAYRCTNPDNLVDARMLQIHIVGPTNSAHIARACDRNQIVIAAWGIRGAYMGRDQQVINQVTKELKKSLWCLRESKDGFPWHPLYIPYSTQPTLWKAA